MLYNIIVSSYQRDNNRTNGRIGYAVMRLGGIRRSNAAEITIRLTQQGMVISLRLFPFPTVLITIYRLRRISICNSLHTAGNGNFASLIPIPYCANHNLPSPTDL